jgi:hypothetical protein
MNPRVGERGKWPPRDVLAVDFLVSGAFGGGPATNANPVKARVAKARWRFCGHASWPKAARR